MHVHGMAAIKHTKPTFPPLRNKGARGARRLRGAGKLEQLEAFDALARERGGKLKRGVLHAAEHAGEVRLCANVALPLLGCPADSLDAVVHRRRLPLKP